MAALNFHELFVVTSGGQWSTTGACGDVVYTDKPEAEAEMEKLKSYNPSSTLIYRVQTLDDYIRDVRDEARADGRNEANQQY